MEPFPVKQPKWHLLNKLPFSVTISFCPACGRGDDGTNMVECEKCKNWSCVPPFNKEQVWYCTSCETLLLHNNAYLLINNYNNNKINNPSKIQANEAIIW